VGRSDSRPRRRGKRARRRPGGNRAPSRLGPHWELRPTPGRRNLAELVDWIVFVGVGAVMVGIGFVLGLPSWGLWVVAIFGAPVLLTIYEVVAIAMWGATLGKRLAGVRVLRADTLEPPGWRRAAIRTLGLAPWSWIPRGFHRYALGRAHGLNDRLAGTVVVNDRAWRSWQRSARSQETTESAGMNDDSSAQLPG
jgi:uncharacterized RDD family membrane protein YckC